MAVVQCYHAKNYGACLIMSGEILIQVENVSKKYCRVLSRSMFYGLQDIARDALGLYNGVKDVRKDEFWSLKDINFTLERGECLGLIGPNGAGKSTLLKLLNGIILPDRGRIITRGKVATLIEIGAGFHPLLSGRENIYINGAILGMSKHYIDRFFDSIVDFAELNNAIDMPVKYYSSGMYVRLGFAIATKLKADIVLLDEILSVGDVRFQAKCFNAINDLLGNSSVIFVSHSMAQISRICSKIGYLNQGILELFEKPADGINKYIENSAVQHALITTGTGRASIQDMHFENMQRRKTMSVNYGDSIRFCLKAEIDSEVLHPVVNISFVSNDMRIVAQCNSFYNDVELTNSGGVTHITLQINKLCLNPGNYNISVGIMAENFGEVLLRVDNSLKLSVRGKFCGYAPVQFQGLWDVL
jgi:lipopolysaccharide transport system ATP-binding protein